MSPSTDLVIVDVGSGNLRSVANAFAHVRGGREPMVTNDPDAVRRAERIVLPGQGAFADFSAGLDATPGLRAALYEAVRERARPYLGICVGMQMMADWGLEHGRHAGFGWIGGNVQAIAPTGGLKIPQMGWNDLRVRRSHPVLAGIGDGAHAYFVHSYAFVPASGDSLIADVDYGGAVTAIVGHGNLIGCQFHPEKSQATGLRLLANFLAWTP